MPSLAPEERAFFAAPGPLTDLALHAGRLRALPPDVGDLCRIVQGLLIHPFLVHLYGVAPGPERQAELQIRTAGEALARAVALGGADLAAARPPEARVLGNCRHHSVMMTALLRARGVPARARCGFGTYFQADRRVDHWITEWWDDARGRWVRTDPQIDDVQRAALAIRCDTLDLAPEDFLVAGEAWRRCRDGRDDPMRFGILDMWGLWFVRGNVVRDVASLAAKLELLPWDGWGAALARDEELGAEDLAALDRAAQLTAQRAPPLDELESVYETARFRVPDRITSWVEGAPREVELAIVAR